MVLSENADFAEEAEKNIIFIGPNESNKNHGSKLAAKEAVTIQYSMVPGFDEAITDVEKQKSLRRKLVFNTY
jgi:acetyl/propionyl-CoA carboxylase alpha subunit